MTRTRRKQTRKAPNDYSAAPAPRRGSEPGKLRFVVAAAAVLFAAGLAGYAAFFMDESPFAPRAQTEQDDGSTPKLNPLEPPGSAPTGMVWVRGGEFYMGDETFQDAQHIHRVYVDGFWMDKTEVTNAQFAQFVKETGYLTVAERKPNLKDFPNLYGGLQWEYVGDLAVAPASPFPAALPWGSLFHTYPALEPFSIVFAPPLVPVNPNTADHKLWWRPVNGASWRHPEGPKSHLKGRENHPVVHVCWLDAVAYCEWRSKKEKALVRLPTEAEWEFAGRGGLDRKPYTWGEELNPGGKCQANIWHGNFPRENTKDDGFEGTAPVGSFPPNGYGLHDMSGNVWEWCADWYQPDYYTHSPKRNPKGPSSSFDPQEPQTPKRVQRGGSFLCCDNYCVRYMVGSRGKGEPTSSASHVGFRCVREAR